MKWLSGNAERAACAEAREAALFGPADAAAAARVHRHVAHCAACQAQQQRLQATRTAVAAADAPLDDLTRARMLDRLSSRLDDLAAGRGQKAASPRAVRTRWLVGGAALAAAAALALFARPAVDARRGAGPNVAGEVRPGLEVPSVAERASDAATDPAVIRLDDAPTVGRTRLTVPAGARTRARLGGHTRFVLVGPADLQVTRARADLLEVYLHSGTLLAEHDHDAHRRLRVFSPHTTTEIVGTTFLVEAGAGRSRVAVAHGRVLVRNEQQPARIVTAGEMWSTAATQDLPTLASPEVSRLFAEGARAGIGARADVEPERDEARAVPAVPAPPLPAPPLPAGASPIAPGRIARATSSPHFEAAASRPGRRAAAAPPRAAAPLDAPVALTAPPPVSSPPPPPLVPAPQPSPAPQLSPAVTPPPPPVPPAPDAAGLYQLAEQAMGRGDDGEATRRLEQLVALPAAPTALTALARFELAQRALRKGDLAAARRWLHPLDGGPLSEPAQLFACDLDLRAGALAAARRCYERFRAAHPGSVQDAEAQGALLQLMPASELCASGQAALLEYLARHPRGARADELRRRSAACAR